MTTTPLTDAINALTRYANDTTGAGDTNLSDAVGTLVAGYGGGSSAPVLLYKWDLTKSLTDEVGGFAVTITNATQDENGVHLTGANNYIRIPSINVACTTVEVDISSMDCQKIGSNCRLLLYNQTSGHGLVYRSTRYWGIYTSTWQMTTNNDANYFSGHTLKVVFDEYQYPKIYRDNTLMLIGSARWSLLGDIGSTGNGFYNMDVTGIRIYKGDTTQ